MSVFFIIIINPTIECGNTLNYIIYIFLNVHIVMIYFYVRNKKCFLMTCIFFFNEIKIVHSDPELEEYNGGVSQNVDYCWIYIRFYTENGIYTHTYIYICEQFNNFNKNF